MLRIAYFGLAATVAAGLVIPNLVPSPVPAPDETAAPAAAPAAAERVVMAVEAPRKERSETGIAGRKLVIDSDRRGHYVADFRLNGRSVEAMVDTGATTVAINYETARRIGLMLTNSDFKYQVTTANGTTKAASVTLDSVEVGRIQVRNVEAAVLQDNALSNTLIGMSFLNKLKNVQVSGRRLTLEQ